MRTRVGGCLAYLDDPNMIALSLNCRPNLHLLIQSIYGNRRAMCVSDVNDFILVSLLLTLNRFHTLPLYSISDLEQVNAGLKRLEDAIPFGM